MALDTRMPVNGVDVREYADIEANGFFAIGDDGRPITQVTGADAIKNVIKLYLFSAQGDYGRGGGNPQKGGILFDAIGAQLTESNARWLETKISDGVAKAFDNIAVQKVVVSLDIENKMFVCTLYFSDDFNKLASNISFGIPAE